MPFSQSQRRVGVTSPLGEDVLLLLRMSGHEALSTPFEYQVDLLSEDDQISLDDVLARPMCLRLDLPEGGSRHFHGMVSRFTQQGVLEFGERLTGYRATLRPWLWFLTRTADCRIFQEQSVPDIVKSIFQEHGFSDFEERLSGSYRSWLYCVQYRETDFNFISRLLEQEGIYYYFRHSPDKHTLVLCDDYSSHDPVPGYAEIPYFPPQHPHRRERDHISAWTLERQVQPGTFAVNDYDYLVPKKSLQASSAQSRKHPLADLEIYDYPGEYDQSNDGQLYARLRLEELQARHEIVRGEGNPYGLAVGALFTLTQYPRADQNREHLVTAADWQLTSDIYESGGGAGQEFSCAFQAQSARQPFRPERHTPKPVVQGPQTAVVVGPGGEEIWTDEHARVKVQFHWDRYGKSDENSSCWVRVAQLWAGKSWGGIHIPRIGQEVIVEFLEGDPDRPIITGRVYNGDNKPPYGLPANATQSGILSRSSKGGSGSNANEIRFEDKKGSEHVLLHAEKDQDIEVENDEGHWVGHDRKKQVDHNERVAIGNDRQESVGRNESISIGKDRTESVGSNEKISIGKNRTESVGEDEQITIGDNRTERVGKDETITIGKNRTTSIGKEESLTVGDDRNTRIGKDDKLQVGDKFALVAGDEILLQTGSASIRLKKNGDIQIKGKNITISGSGKIGIKASGQMTLKGSKIAEN